MTEKEELPTSGGLGNLVGLWRTRAARMVVDAIDVCDRGGCMGVITGPSGVGKTTAARAKLDAVRNSSDADDEVFGRFSVHYVALTAAAEKMQPGLLRIAQTIGATVAGQGTISSNDLHDYIVAKLREPRSLLVVDEAQFASDALLHCLRGIWDELNAGLRPRGLVLIGTSDLARRLRGGSAKARAFDPLVGRLGVWLELERPDTEDLGTIAHHFGLSGSEAIKLIGRAAGSPGGLHMVRRLMAAACRLAGTGRDLTLADLTTASAALGSGQ